MCFTQYGLAGLNCNELCSQGYSDLVISIIASLLALVLTVISFYLLFKVISNRSSATNKVTPIVITLACTGFGMLLITIAVCIGLVITIGFPNVYQVILLGKREIRESPLSSRYAASACAVLGYCTSLVAIVILPLAWVSMKNDGLCVHTH